MSRDVLCGLLVVLLIIFFSYLGFLLFRYLGSLLSARAGEGPE